MHVKGVLIRQLGIYHTIPLPTKLECTCHRIPYPPSWYISYHTTTTYAGTTSLCERSCEPAYNNVHVKYISYSHKLCVLAVLVPPGVARHELIKGFLKVSWLVLLEIACWRLLDKDWLMKAATEVDELVMCELDWAEREISALPSKTRLDRRAFSPNHGFHVLWQLLI